MQAEVFLPLHSSIIPGGGNYIYIEASSPRKANENAKLLSPLMRGPRCFRFFYHMYGRDIGSLDVSLQRQDVKINDRVMLWRRKGEQGNRWKNASIDIGSSGGEFQVGMQSYIKHYSHGTIIEELKRKIEVRSSNLPLVIKRSLQSLEKNRVYCC